MGATLGESSCRKLSK
jgi:hypothetical protein